MAEVDEVDGEVDKPETGKVDAEEPEESQEPAPVRSDETDAFWGEVRVQPVEIALPKGVGLTLRAYRAVDEVTFSTVDREEDDYAILDRPVPRMLDDEDDDDLDDDAEQAVDADDEDEADRTKTKAKDPDADDPDAEDADEDAAAKDPADEPVDEDFDDEDDAETGAAAADAEEIPVFLGHAGKVYLFETPEALVEFVRSDAEHDLAQIDSWQTIQERITAADVVPADDDRYELDLIVENLRGGPDAWESDLLIAAGEVARDLGYALRIDPILAALAPGSPVDDLDEALRSAGAGGLGGFFAKRRLRKMAAQQVALSWRTIIGKISAAVDWRK